MQIKSDFAKDNCIPFSWPLHSQWPKTRLARRPTHAMQSTYHHHTDFPQSRGGGRVSSPGYRQSLELSEEFAGLEEDVDRYDLLLLVKRVGKGAGFTPRMIQLLDYYMAFTRDLDWRTGGRPIVYQSLARTSLDLGVSERQIQKLEQQLFAAGAITWHDSGNHKRYGQRDPRTGEILFAFGVDLTPLAFLRQTLEEKLHEKQLYDKAWLETKRQISWYRRQILATFAELEREEGSPPGELQVFFTAYEEIAFAIRTYMPLEELRTLLERHKALHGQLIALAPSMQPGDREINGPSLREMSHKSSCRDDTKFVHYKFTTQQSSDESDTDSPADDCFQESVVEPSRAKTKSEKKETQGRGDAQDREALILATGLQHISLKQVLLAAGERFREQLPLHPRPMNWTDVVEAAYRLRPQLHISQQSWAEACGLLGRNGAAICLLLTDRATQREDTPVLKPAGYFRAMLKRAESRQLKLQCSIFGLTVSTLRR